MSDECERIFLRSDPDDGNLVIRSDAAFFALGKLPKTFLGPPVPEARGLPSTYTQPWFWGRRGSWISPHVKRELHATWVCCCNPGDWIETTAWTKP